MSFDPQTERLLSRLAVQLGPPQVQRADRTPFPKSDEARDLLAAVGLYVLGLDCPGGEDVRGTCERLFGLEDGETVFERLAAAGGKNLREGLLLMKALGLRFKAERAATA